ncbi:MAG: 30S ribosomal protein S8 [Clostridia bacterium]|nr:30S ribosomal protein S8 [Clostridia bacterium]
MIVTDPIADMLTRMRNALTVKKNEVLIPASKTKNAIAKILFDEGYVEKYELVDDGNYKSIKVTFKFGPNGEKIIQGLKRISKPGLRVYAECGDIPKVLNGLGIAIVSTNKGIMTDKEARNQNVGGEVLAFVW